MNNNINILGFRIAFGVNYLLLILYNFTIITFMTKHEPVSFLSIIVNISSFAAIMFCTSSCHTKSTSHMPTNIGMSSGTSPATQEFINKHGFRPSDYYGAKGKNDYVPGKVPTR